MKLVINKCYGGFSLSEAAVKRYAEIKGVTLYLEYDKRFKSMPPTYWTVPESERVKELPGNWQDHSFEDRQEYNRKCTEQNIYDRDLPRDDKVLIQVVEELGEEADGSSAKLAIIEIPDGIDWIIDEYDGMERVEEAHRSWS